MREQDGWPESPQDTLLHPWKHEQAKPVINGYVKGKKTHTGKKQNPALISAAWSFVSVWGKLKYVSLTGLFE